jgi:hypothetical protein
MDGWMLLLMLSRFKQARSPSPRARASCRAEAKPIESGGRKLELELELACLLSMIVYGPAAACLPFSPFVEPAFVMLQFVRLIIVM